LRCLSLFRRWRDESSGMAAVEFALLAPLMIAIFLLTLEFTQAIDTNRKLGNMTLQIAEITTREPDVTPSMLQSIVKIGEATMQPYSRSTPAVRITAIDVSTGSRPDARVAWSRCYYHCSVLPAAAVGSTVPLANNLKIA